MRWNHCLTILAASMICAAATVPARTQMQQAAPPAVPGLTLTSPDIEDGGVIPNKFTQAVDMFI
jgi:hypothetical protein